MLGLLGILSFGLVPTAVAAEFDTGETVIIPEGEVIDDDLFVTGNRVEINGTVKGDLFATGNLITVNGTVEGSMFSAAQSIEINGEIGGSLYTAGYSIKTGEAASIGRNVYFAGFSFSLAGGGTVGRGVYGSGYQLVLDGEVANDVVASVASLNINGTVGGDVVAEVGEVDQGFQRFYVPMAPMPVVIEPPGYNLGSEAVIQGQEKIQVQQIESPEGPKPEDVEKAVGGAIGAFFTSVFAFIAAAVARRIGEFIAVLIVGALMIALWPAFFERVRTQQFWPSGGYGCLSIIGFIVLVPVAFLALILLVIIGGLVTFGVLVSYISGIGGSILGLLISTFLFALTLVSIVVVSYLVGRWILLRFSEREVETAWFAFGALALGAFIYEILRAIPLGLGWFVSLLVAIFGIGYIVLTVRDMYFPPRERPAAESLPAETSEE
jgi:cytoskeletal protein CcmA (bactofilin family)